MKYLLLLSLLSMSACVAGLPKSGPAVVELTTQAEAATNSSGDVKSGKACAQSILGLVATGDASVDAAKKNAGITNISTMNREFFGLNIYILRYAKVCTVVTGS